MLNTRARGHRVVMDGFWLCVRICRRTLVQPKPLSRMEGLCKVLFWRSMVILWSSGFTKRILFLVCGVYTFPHPDYMHVHTNQKGVIKFDTGIRWITETWPCFGMIVDLSTGNVWYVGPLCRRGCAVMLTCKSVGKQWITATVTSGLDAV